MIFCSKYHIIYHYKYNKTGLKKEDILLIFKRFAKNGVHMSFE